MLRQLDSVFLDKDRLREREVKAATAIATIVRGHLVRKRHMRCVAAMERHRMRFGRVFFVRAHAGAAPVRTSSPPSHDAATTAPSVARRRRTPSPNRMPCLRSRAGSDLYVTPCPCGAGAGPCHSRGAP